MNQGAWFQTQHKMRQVIAGLAPFLNLEYAGRDSFAATAGGYMQMHNDRQQRLVRDALFG